MATTQYAQAHYQEVIDLHTEANTVSVIGFHTPTGDGPYDMLKGFFDQFRKYMYGGMKFSLVPVARLPADPLQVSYEAGDAGAQMDPRDLMNPIMFKGCHGDDMGTILNSYYGGIPLNSGWGKDTTPSSEIISGLTDVPGVNDDIPLENLYYSALTDNTWLKAHPQAGMRKSGLRPMVYSLGTTVPLGAGGTLGGSPSDNEDGGYIGAIPKDVSTGVTGGEAVLSQYRPNIPKIALSGTSNVQITPSWSTLPPFITPRLQRLGWLDTHNYVTSSPNANAQTVPISNIGQGLESAYARAEVRTAKLPKVFMGMMMLPPAYTTEQYFRLVIDHTFHFKQFRGISNKGVYDVEDHQYHNFNA